MQLWFEKALNRWYRLLFCTIGLSNTLDRAADGSIKQVNNEDLISLMYYNGGKGNQCCDFIFLMPRVIAMQ